MNVKKLTIPVSAFLVFAAVVKICSAEPWGRVSFLVGAVQIQRGGKILRPQLNMTVEAGDKIKTGSESSIHLLHTDEHTTIKVTENSNMDLEPSSVGGATVAKLLDGGLVASIKKITGRRCKIVFTTPSATASIRGTVLSLRYLAKTHKTILSVFEGIVRFGVGKKLLDIRAGQRAFALGGNIHKTTIPESEVLLSTQAARWDSLEESYLAGLSKEEKDFHRVLDEHFIMQRTRLVAFRDSVASLSPEDREKAIAQKKKEIDEDLEQIEIEATKYFNEQKLNAREQYKQQIQRKRNEIQKHLEDVRKRITERMD